ncbi:hypothetical protein [Bdellovibrio sp. HCB288]|uniref:hypothetical protein n=1 Tax=Bdellovibrio sp. HCB288 TaxID=3394355 RepID=UPI0039B49E1D
MNEKAQAVVEQIKGKALEISKKHSKALAAELNVEVLPLVANLVKELIPGQVDDLVIDVAIKPVIEALNSAVEAI